jgi:hypothetical protein
LQNPGKGKHELQIQGKVTLRANTGKGELELQAPCPQTLGEALGFTLGLI